MKGPEPAVQAPDKVLVGLISIEVGVFLTMGVDNYLFSNMYLVLDILL